MNKYSSSQAVISCAFSALEKTKPNQLELQMTQMKTQRSNTIPCLSAAQENKAHNKQIFLSHREGDSKAKGKQL